MSANAGLRVSAPLSAIDIAAARLSTIAPDAATSDRYQLRYLGDPVLRQTAATITSREQIDVVLLSSMRKVLSEKGGAALAAPQVGAPVRIIVVRLGSGGDMHAFINPRIVFRSPTMVRHLTEGCLSIPDFYTNIMRHESVVVEYQDFDLQTFTRGASGKEAFAFQHEIDHLDGRLIIDGLSRQQRRQAERRVANALERRGLMGEHFAAADAATKVGTNVGGSAR